MSAKSLSIAALVGLAYFSLPSTGAHAALSPSDDPVTLPDTQVGSTSSAVTLTLTNEGTSIATITSLTLSGADSADFSVTPPADLVLAVGESADVLLDFTPSGVRAHAATLDIEYDDGSSPPPIAVALEGNGMEGATLSASVDPLVAADTRVGDTSANATVTLNNTGDMDADVTDLVLSGANSGDFAVVSATAFTITAGGSADVDVTFSPSAGGLRAAILTVEYDSPAAATLPIDLEGTGLAPEMEVTIVEGASSPLDFGSARVGSAASTTYTIRVSNTGNDVLNASLAESGTHAGDWSYAPSAASFTVAAGAARNIVATFTPSATGSRTATVTLADDDGLSTTASVPIDLEGTGLAPSMDVTIVEGGSSPLDFGAARVGSASSTTYTIRVSNTGDDVLNASLAESGAHAGDWSYAPSATTFTVAAGASRNIVATFTPSAAGARTATVTVSDTDGLSAPASVALDLAGDGLAPQMTVSVLGGASSPLDFGGAKVGAASTTTYTIRVSNTGDDVLNASFAESGAHPGDWSYAPSAASFTVAAGASRDIVATFTPSAAGARTATWTLDDDDGLSTTSTVAFDFEGLGQTPQIAVSPDPLNFAARRVFTTSGTQTVTIDNTGPVELVVSAIALSAGDTGDFDLTTSLPMTIAAGSSGTFSVDFTPQDRGARSATIRITSDAPGSPTEMTVQGTGQAPILTVSKSSLAFANTRVGQTSAAQTFTIDNTGDSSMTVTSVSIPGANADDYTVTGYSGTLAPADAPVTITVRFTPQAAGAQNATIEVVTTNPLPPDTATVSLSGTGTEALLALTPAAGIDFGNTRVDAQSSNGVFTLRNNGNTALTIDGLAFGAPDASQFVLVSPPATPFTIAPATSRTITVRCAPTSVGDKSSSFVVTSDADNGASVPTPPLSCRGVTPDIAVAPGSLDFGSVLVGSTSAPQTITVTNAGGALSAPLDVTIAKLGAAAGDYTVAPTSFTVPVGGSREVTVTFTPSAEGARDATIRINSDDLDEGTIDVAVSGNGVKPELTLVDPASGSIAFGDVNVSSTSDPATVRIRNDGSSDLTVSGVTLAGANPGQFAITGGTVPPPSVVIAPGATASWQVVCTPSSTGAKSALFRLTSDDADEGTVNVPMSCTGVQAQLTVSPSPVSFPVTRVCDTADPQTITVRNSGTADLTVTSLSVTPASVFPTVTAWPTLPITLGPDETFDFELAFEPAAHSDYAGTLTIGSDDPSSPSTNVTLLGPGRVAEMVLSDMAFDYGGVRVDEAAVEQTFTVRNNGTTSFVLGSVTVDDTLNFTLEPVSPAAWPATLQPAPAGPGGLGEVATFRVLSHPTVLGEVSTVVRVNTDIPTCMPVVASIDLDAEGIAPDMALDPAVLDYGGHDVQAAAPAMQVASIQNTGTAPLEIDGLEITGTYASEFALVSPPALPTTIPVGGSLDLDVEFQPSVMRMCDATDGDAFVEVASDGYTVPTARVRLEGCGLDRVLDLSTLGLAFPPTYRNPEDPSILEVRITNTGTYKLVVSATTTSDMEVFSLVNGGPREIEPGASDTLEVAFNPTTASPIPFEGVLTIANDDDANPMAAIELSGVGVLPEVVCDPCNVSFGGTAVGLRTTIPGRKIHINNMNSDRAFTVRELRLVDQAGEPLEDAAFEILGFDGPIEVPASGSVELDVAFSPERAGSFQARVDVYIDADELVQTFVTLTGEGVGARARGSGCAVASGEGVGGAWLLIGVALLWASRRRRGAALLVAVAVSALAGAAAADRSQNVDLDTFRPAVGGSPTLITVETPEVGRAGTFSLGVFFDYALRPLGIERTDLSEISYPVEHRSATELALGYAFGGRFEVGASLPVLSQSGDERMLNVDPASGTVLGDAALTGKVLIARGGPFALGGSTVVTVPTATDQEFAGVDGPSWHARAIASVHAGRARVAANLGMRLRKQVEFLDVVQGNELTFGLGGAYALSRRSSVIGELYGAMGMTDGNSEATTPVEASLGLRYRMSRAWGVALGASRGVLPGLGSPSARGFLLLAYTPGASAMPRLKPVVPEKVIDRGDDDADSIINEYDRCPDDIEDYDDFEDEDGCPDPDNDGDGLDDEHDKCPNQAEDKDGYEDGDGCIDKDNDGDGVPDTRDACPDEAEDKDGYLDNDGCDDPDNDRDGIPDVIDQCALEPETINGRDDDDGCADDGDSAVLESEGRIDLIEPIKFRGNTARLGKGDDVVLAQVGALMRARPEWKKLRIGVHVHPRNRRDEALSLARAETVKAWLVEWGVDGDRLEVKGYGSSRPLVPSNARRASAINDRVEVVITEAVEPGR